MTPCPVDVDNDEQPREDEREGNRRMGLTATAGAKFSFSHWQHAAQVAAHQQAQSQSLSQSQSPPLLEPESSPVSRSIFIQIKCSKLVSIIFYRVEPSKNCKLIIAMRHLLPAVDTN